MILKFGQYKGLEVEDVASIDLKYLLWLVRQDWLWKNVKNGILNDLKKSSEKKHRKVAQAILESQPQPEQENSRVIQAIIARITEALTHRGYTQSEAEQMIRRVKNQERHEHQRNS